MLKCRACGRSGGPFRFRRQAAADGQLIRAWCCPCGHTFHALAGAERTTSIQGDYTGFTVEWNGRSIVVRLKSIGKHDVLWCLSSPDGWRINVAGPLTGPGSRHVSLISPEDEPAAEWRLEPGWGAAEILRRIRVQPVPAGIEPEPMARILHRLLN